MTNNQDVHDFFIPVMGTAFTIDSPIKIAKYGISSVVSIGDDELCEEMRQYYAKEYDLDYTSVGRWDNDPRARRIQLYLDLMDTIINKKIDNIKKEAFLPKTDITTYFELLDISSPLKQDYLKMMANSDETSKKSMQHQLREAIVPGSIDVNIMTKLDKVNYDQKGTDLGEHFTDALSALRGFATSSVHSGIVLSAGINRKLYT